MTSEPSGVTGPAWPTPPGWPGVGPLPAPPPAPHDSLGVKGAVGFATIAVAVGALLALPTGWLWVLLSNPPKVPLASSGGIYLDEQALNDQAGITLWYFVVGVVVGAVAGLVMALLGRRYGWLTVLAILAMAAVATILARYLGANLFGAHPADEASHASPGELIQVGVSLDTWVAYLGWPIGAMAGALAGIATWRENLRRNPPPAPVFWPTVGQHVAGHPSRLDTVPPAAGGDRRPADRTSIGESS